MDRDKTWMVCAPLSGEYSLKFLRLVITEYVDSIPSFRFWSGRKNKYHACKIETGFLFGDVARVIRFFARAIQQLRFWTQKIQANVDYCCYVRRRAECTSLGPGLKHPSLRSDSSLAAKSRTEALHAVFFSTKHPLSLIHI